MQNLVYFSHLSFSLVRRFFSTSTRTTNIHLSLAMSDILEKSLDEIIGEKKKEIRRSGPKGSRSRAGASRNVRILSFEEKIVPHTNWTEQSFSTASKRQLQTSRIFDST